MTKFQIRGQELKFIAQWGLTGIGTFLIFSPLENIIGTWIKDSSVNVWNLILSTIQLEWKAMALGMVIVAIVAYLFNLK